MEATLAWRARQRAAHEAGLLLFKQLSTNHDGLVAAAGHSHLGDVAQTRP